MIVYGATLSPFVRKAMAYGAEKGLPLKLKLTNPGAPDPEFRRASPFGKMPGFSDGDFYISDSTAIITYLEAKHPEPALLPADPQERARVVWYEEFADTILVAASGKIFFNRIVAPRFMGKAGDEAAADHAEKNEVPPLIDYVESVIPESGYLVGDRLTLADIAVASPFVNLLHVGIRPDAEKHPKTTAFVAHMHARPSFAGLIAQERGFLGT